MTEEELIAAVRRRLSADPQAPATEQELAEAEQQLGFALHPLLRRLYWRWPMAAGARNTARPA